MAHELFFWPAPKRAFRKLPQNVQVQLKPVIDNVKVNPRPPGAAKLSGHIRRWRVRLGTYRVVYEIDEEMQRIIVVAAGHRSSVYRTNE